MLLLRTGTFHDIMDGLSFYARDRGSKGELLSILIHDTRKPEKPVTIMAESGDLIPTPEGPQILVKNGMRQEVEQSTGVLSQLIFDSYMVDFSNITDNFLTRWREPRERSMYELLTPKGKDVHPKTIKSFFRICNT